MTSHSGNNERLAAAFSDGVHDSSKQVAESSDSTTAGSDSNAVPGLHLSMQPGCYQFVAYVVPRIGYMIRRQFLTHPRHFRQGMPG